jgi:hypothetical protein
MGIERSPVVLDPVKDQNLFTFGFSAAVPDPAGQRGVWDDSQGVPWIDINVWAKMFGCLVMALWNPMFKCRVEGGAPLERFVLGMCIFYSSLPCAILMEVLECFRIYIFRGCQMF